MTTYEYLDCSDDDRRQPLIFIELLPLHKQVRLKRLAENFTQPALAQMIGMGASTLCEYENGARVLPSKHIARMKSYLYDEMYVNGVLQTGKEHYYG